jgi:hypothetical protein
MNYTPAQKLYRRAKLSLNILAQAGGDAQAVEDIERALTALYQLDQLRGDVASRLYHLDKELERFAAQMQPL